MRVFHPAYETFHDRKTGVSFTPEVVEGRTVAVADVPDGLVKGLVARGFRPVDAVVAANKTETITGGIEVRRVGTSNYYDLVRDGVVIERVLGRAKAEAAAAEVA